MKQALALLFVLSMPLFAAKTAKLSGEAIVYKKVNGREMKLYLSKPADWKSGDRRPAIVFFHGGGWVGGSPSSFNGHCEYFASRGLVCATVDYRLIQKGASETPLVCVQDAKSAMRWVRSHAKELGIVVSRTPNLRCDGCEATPGSWESIRHELLQPAALQAGI
jgi:acetyl esterase